MKKQLVDNRSKRFYGEMWGIAVWRGGACENPVRLSRYGGPMEAVKYMWVNIWCMLDWIVRLAEIHFLGISECMKWDAIMTGEDKLCENTKPLQGVTFDGTT